MRQGHLAPLVLWIVRTQLLRDGKAGTIGDICASEIAARLVHPSQH